MRFNSKNGNAALGILFSLLLLSGAALASGTATAPTVVQFGGTIISSSVSPRPSFTTNAKPGNLVVCHYAWTTGTAATPAPGAGWSTAVLDTLGKNGIFYLWAPSPAGTLPPIVTNNPAGGNDPHIACWEVNGANQGNPIAGATIARPANTARPPSALITPSAVQAELELGYFSQSGATPSPSPSSTPSATVTSEPISGNSGFFGLPAEGTYTGNSLPFQFIFGGVVTGTQTVFNVDIQGYNACGDTLHSLSGVGC